MKRNEELCQAFGVSLQTLRLKQVPFVSQEDLAAECGVPRAHMSSLERGLHSPNLDTMFRLAEGLLIPFSVLAREIERNYEAIRRRRR